MTADTYSSSSPNRSLEKFLLELNFQKSPSTIRTNGITDNMTSPAAQISNGNGDATMSAFRVKVAYMKNWKPASAPSNRDKLELYALHKQAVSGDAPPTLATQTAADRAKYQSWKTKAGLSSTEAIRQYMQEAERQIRVYGGTIAALSSSGSNPSLTDASTTNPASAGATQPRGLAAIPLLCAAASESRPAYLRRLANTRMEQAWWRRQEALTATPGSFWALPETLLLAVASLLEFVSLSVDLPLVPSGVVQSFLWPLHNSLLSMWMAYILVATAWGAAWHMSTTLLWGSRRTGLSLESLWKDQVAWTAQSGRTLTEAHQPLTARLVGLVLYPYSLLVWVTNAAPAVMWQAVAYTILMMSTWWYWSLIVPTLTVIWLGGAAFLAGNCFALIELAGV